MDYYKNDKFPEKYNGMYKVSETKSRFLTKERAIKTINVKRESFEFKNANLYCEETGELLKEALQWVYNTDFVIDLYDMYILNLRKYLDFHYNNGNNKKEFLEYVKYFGKSDLPDNIQSLMKDWANDKENELNNHPTKTIEAEQTKEISPKKYTAKEYALIYILDLYADNKKVPKRSIDDTFAKKEIEKLAKEYCPYHKPDTFYNAVKDIVNDYNLNKEQDLKNISKDWLNVVKELSKDWGKLSTYLKGNKLLGE